MRIALSQLNLHIGNFEGNLAKMLSAVEAAKAQNADLICFPELAVCGYPPRDFLEFDDFIKRCQASIEALCAVSHDLAIVVGAPTRNPVLAGKDLYNSAYFLYQGSIQAVQHKALLPTYDIFDEYRYFEPATEFKTVTYKGKKIALSICEDIWNLGNENPLYTICPLDEMMPEKPDFILNISASPFNYAHANTRIHTVKANVNQYKIPMFYTNMVGGQTDVIFDGGSLVVSPDGMVFDEMPYFEECLKVYELEDVMKGGRQQEQPKDKIRLIHDALVLGIRDYFQKLGFSKAILGLSGGIDSAVTAVLATEALGPDNVRVLLMPSQFSSDHSVKDAKDLAENLGIHYDIVAIKPVYDAFESALHQQFEGLAFNVTEENIQARVRGTLLMAMSNKFGNILLNTTNKSEMSVGYGTLYGDMCGGLAVLGDVYKTEIYELVKYINSYPIGKQQMVGVIPQNSIAKPPSAELRPGQKDTDSLPPYEVLDPLLYQYIECRKGPSELIEMGFEEALVKRVLRMVNINEFKREQAAPVIRVSSKAFGMGRRLPIVGKYLS
ncbi:MAG TPA: NAD+ synthase [Saprospiraceae bacterium]|nr:NAD+ synthase [Saprospiraceae bacterium]